jgi:hypothetical protein
MSFKSSLLKMAIEWTPTFMVIWVANIILKGIAELTDFSFDLDTRKAYIQTRLYGEEEIIEIWLEGFAIVSDEEAHKFIIQQAQSNRPWLNNLLAHFVGKAWKIPVIPQLSTQIELITELLKVEEPEQKDS